MENSAWPAPLAGQTILVAEDDALISSDISALLSEAGASVVTVKDQGQALLAAIGDRLTAAVLCNDLGDDSISSISDCLARRSIPFLSTAVSAEKDQKGGAAPRHSQPFDGGMLVDDLLRLLVTGGDMLDLDNTTRIDLIIFGAQTRLERQERIVEELTRGQQDLRNADALLRTMRASLELLLTHRRRLTGQDEVMN